MYIPYADNSLYHIPQGISVDVAVMISDILPTDFEIGVLCGKVQPGDNVVIVGAAPIGIATQRCLQRNYCSGKGWILKSLTAQLNA